MRFPSLKSIRSSFSVETRHKDKKIHDLEIVEWDGEDGFNISLPSDERLGSLKKVGSGISHFRRMMGLGRSLSKSSSPKRHEDCSEDSRNVTDSFKGSSQGSVSLTHHFYEYPSNGSVRDEVARLVLSRLMSHDDAITEQEPKRSKGNDIDCIEVAGFEVQEDRYSIPVFSDSDDDSVTLNTLHRRNNSYEDTVFDGIMDDTIAVDTLFDTTNQDHPTPKTSAHISSCGRGSFNQEPFWPSVVVTCFRMPMEKKATPFTPGSDTVAWDDTVMLSAFSY